MRVCHSLLFLSLLFSANLCSATDVKSFQIVGNAQCTDCQHTTNPFSGLHVTIDCKPKNGDIKRFGSGDLDGNGQFKISIPDEIIENELKLKHDCYAQLHSAAAVPCPVHAGLEATKIVFANSQNDAVRIFSPTQTLKFSAALCNSKFFLTHPKSPHPWLKNLGHHGSIPPLLPLYKHKHISPPIFHKPPVYTPPTPVPVYTPPTPVPVYNPPTPVPVYTPPTPVPVYNPPTPVPVYKPPVKKPCPPAFKPKPVPPPVKKPCPPVQKPPVISKPPVYKPPVITNPVPPTIPVNPLFPPLKKKPCPPLLSKLPPYPPKIHPKFGHFPPHSPAIPLP